MNFRSYLRRLRQLFAGRTSRQPFQAHQVRLGVDALEDRAVPAVVGGASAIRSIDGTGNNLQHPEWGSTNTEFIRIAPAEYADGISSVAGEDRPSPRVISNSLAEEGEVRDLNERGLSAMIFAWGQFIDHDLDLTNTGKTEKMSIPVPQGDPFFDPQATGTKTIDTFRSIFSAESGTSTDNPREQVNSITTWIDGSMVYGSDKTTADSLRSFSGGKMKTSEGNLLPVGANGMFLAGDIRVNENPQLTSLHTLFVREHNAQADRIAKSNPKLTDEQIYQKARGVVIAEIQSITYNQWLPAVLGTNAVDRYTGYKADVNPAIANEFATAGFRFGHSLLGEEIGFLDNSGKEVRDAVSLKDAFFNTSLLTNSTVGPLLKSLASESSSELDNQIVGSVRNFLFGPPGSGGLDLASLNIQRGRDHGLADYNTTRAAYGLPKVTGFDQISSDPAVQAKLQELYGSVDNIDLWVGGLAEDHLKGSSVGPTLSAIISDQFERVRDGDRFWYQHTFTGQERRQLDNTSLSDLIRRHTDIQNVQANPFFFKVSIAGTVFEDANRDGRRTGPEKPAANRAVELVEKATNEVVASTQTNAQGRYEFDVQDGLGTGEYLVRVVLPEGVTPNRGSSKPVVITRGDQFVKDVDLALAPPPAQGQQPRPRQAAPTQGTQQQAPAGQGAQQQTGTAQALASVANTGTQQSRPTPPAPGQTQTTGQTGQGTGTTQQQTRPAPTGTTTQSGGTTQQQARPTTARTATTTLGTDLAATTDLTYPPPASR